MPRHCTICYHLQRKEIDQALVEGVSSVLALSSVFDVSESALRRHKTNHLPATLARAAEAAEVARADGLLGRLEALQMDAYRIRDKAESAGDYKTALVGVRELVRIVELVAKVSGELDESTKVAVVVTQSPEWLALRQKILAALLPYPEARAALAEAIR